MKHMPVKFKKDVVQDLVMGAVLVIVTCWNGSMIDTGTAKDKRPDVDFYGFLTDHVSTCKVEDILIGGKYEQIPFYQVVSEKKVAKDISKDAAAKTNEMDPKQNKTLLDLKEIAVIELKYSDQPTEHEISINNKKYVEVEITTITGSKQSYLVESSRELSCAKMDTGVDDSKKAIYEERKLYMIHVKKLEIQGYKSGQDSKKSKYESSQSSEKTEIAAGTEKILDQIEEKVKNLPQEDVSNYEKIKSSLLSLLKSLRSQLQKMLDLIKG